MICLQDGDYDKIEHFLQGRTDVIVSIDVKDKQTGNTPLIWAAKKGHIKVGFTWLLKKGHIKVGFTWLLKKGAYQGRICMAGKEGISR